MSLLWHGFDLWPWNFCMPQMQPKEKKNKKAFHTHTHTHTQHTQKKGGRLPGAQVRRLGNYCLVGTEFQYSKMKKFWRSAAKQLIHSTPLNCTLKTG